MGGRRHFWALRFRRRLLCLSPTDLKMGGPLSLDVLTADVKTLQGLLRDGRLTSRALVEAYLTQINKHDDHFARHDRNRAQGLPDRDS